MPHHVCLWSLLAAAKLLHAASLPYPTWPGHHTVKSFDGTKLNVYTEKPISLIPGKKFPLVVFINSWAVPGFEYLSKTIGWASKGYVCVEYAARGWFLSGGKVDVVGPDNVWDAITIVDWALREFPQADPAAIGMGGVSYGAVVSQLTAAADPRIRAVLAMSGTSDMLADVYWQESVGKAWGWLLVASGKIPLIGHLDPSVTKFYDDLVAHRNMSGLFAWARNRSMVNVMDKINANRPAIYMSHQHQDNLFHSNIELKAWQSLQGPKKFDMHQGGHATAEILGLFGVDFYKTASKHLWGNALRWVDRWLKGIRNGVEEEPPVQVQLGGEGPRSGYVSFSDWPPRRNDFVVQSLLLGPRGNSSWGSLEQQENTAASDSIAFSDNLLENPMTTGIVAISDLFKVLVPIVAPLGEVNPRFGIVYRGPVQKSQLRMCGIPTLDGLRLTPSSNKFGVVVYLYDMDSSDLGKLITHGTKSVWPEDGTKAGRAVTLPSIEFHSICYDMPQGHRLALGINLYDFLYEAVDKGASISVEYGAAPAALRLPVLQGLAGQAAISI